MTLELPTSRFPSLAEMRVAMDRHAWTNAFVCTIFAVTGPVAIILTVAAAGGLSQAATDGWIFGSFFVGGVLTILCSLFYRQPQAIACQPVLPTTAGHRLDNARRGVADHRA